jgi:hypothetical protein
MKVKTPSKGFVVAISLGAILLGVSAYKGKATYGSPQVPETFGDWSAPVNVGPPLNTPYNDNYAVLSKDGLTIYFTSDRPGGLGAEDLWFATRESVDSPWREPLNMGAPINTAYADSLPFLSSDEHILYFQSTRPGGCGQGDI